MICLPFTANNSVTAMHPRLERSVDNLYQPVRIEVSAALWGSAFRCLKFDVVFSRFIKLDDLALLFFRFGEHLLVSDFAGGSLGFMCGVRIDFARGAHVLVIESVTDHG